MTAPAAQRRARSLAILFAALLLTAATEPGPANEIEHVVQAGETLGGIANRAGVPLVVIAEANGLADPYRVRLGQTLVIPRQRIHVVESGQTGFGIAMRYALPFAEIALANGIAQNAVLKVGQKLIIPAVLPNRPQIVARDPVFSAPHDGKILLGYRRRPDGGGHEGIDIALAQGDMVRASAAGTVIFAGDEPQRFGRLVVIDHGNGWHSSYGHLSKVTVAKGVTIRKGERIGLGGQSGDAERPELHFEIRHDNVPIDPSPMLGIKGKK